MFLKQTVIALLVCATVSLCGCSIFLDTMVATLDRNSRGTIRDGRADDAAGLTSRDKTARWEEENLRSMDRQRKYPKRKTTDPKTNFKKDWENYLQRNR